MVELFVMVDVTTMTNISWRSQYTFLHIRMRIRQMMLTISPVIARAIRFSAPLRNPSFFFKIHGNREVFYYAIQGW